MGWMYVVVRHAHTCMHVCMAERTFFGSQNHRQGKGYISDSRKHTYYYYFSFFLGLGEIMSFVVSAWILFCLYRGGLAYERVDGGGVCVCVCEKR